MTAAPRVPARSTRGALAALALATLLPSLGTSIANVGLPTLAAAFHATFQQVQWVVLAYLLAVTTLIVSVGRLGDLVGRRRLMLAGIALFTLASVAGGVAPTLATVVAMRAAQGIGAATMMALSMALVGEAVDVEHTGRAMGMLGTMSAIGTALGPSLGGLLIGAFGWRAIFLATAPMAIAAFVLAKRFLPADGVAAGAARIRFDHVGTALLGLTLAAYALAMTLGRGAYGMTNLGLLIGAAVGALLFARTEMRVATPLVQVAMFRNPQLRAGFAMSALVTTVVMTALVVGPFYLGTAFALDATHVGFAMSAGPVVSALTGVPAGRLVDRFGAARLTVAGLAAMVVGCSVLPLIPVRAGVFGYIAPLIVVTSGYALFQAANNTAVMSGVSQDRRGVVSGVLSLSRNIGLITGASVMGAVFALGARASGASARVDAVAAGFRLTYGVAAALVGVALGFASVRQSPVPFPPANPYTR